ncbi:hypothetical protein QQF64_024380 [Cirrhinus molitorella]|uniref:Uncharacterized protein n=1 Tax=Cirrhinus molitorella TaxID=172907 RepID=A0ABR3NLS8_9TELE
MGGGSEREKELAELPFVSRFAEEYGEETGANLHCFLKTDTLFFLPLTSSGSAERCPLLTHLWAGPLGQALPQALGHLQEPC